jgi:ribosome biogenesis GTPase
MSDSGTKGLVLRVDAKVCHVDVDGQRVTLPLRGRLFEERGSSKNPVAVGDRVLLGTDGEGATAIEEVLPRTSKLARRAKGDEDREQVLAANVSVVLIVAALAEPPLQPLLIDRILASCERQDLRVAIALTKLDRDKRRTAETWVDLYRGLGYEVFATSIQPGRETPDALEALARLLHENVTVLTGLSGVGKSSLINHLIPDAGLRIGSMNRIRQGKHTTSHTELIPLPGGGHVLDTPGIRNFTLYGVSPHELTFWFREFIDPARRCGFNDCTHRHEPGCAVLEAVADGTIHESRYASFRAVFDELAETRDW